MRTVVSAVLSVLLLLGVSSAESKSATQSGIPSGSSASSGEPTFLASSTPPVPSAPPESAGPSNPPDETEETDEPLPLMGSTCDVMLPDSIGRPTLCELVLSEEGLGPIVLGQPVPASEPGAAVVSGGLAPCYDTESFQWEANYAWTPNLNPAFLVASWGTTAQDPIIEMYVWSDLLHTVEGIGVGSTVSELQAAYGDRLEFFPEVGAAEMSGYSLRGTAGRIVFWVASYEPDVISGIELRVGFDAPAFYYELGC